MKKMIIFLSIILLSGCSNDKRVTMVEPLKSVDKMDIQRYMGVWYELGRYPNSFEKDECDLVTAEYTLLENGKVKVVNSCWKDSVGGKKLARAEGRAVLVKDEVSKLKVTFFWPFSGNYWVIELDDKDYSYAVVSEPKRKYLWILTRSPVMDSKRVEEIKDRLTKNGFNCNRILWNRFMKK